LIDTEFKSELMIAFKEFYKPGEKLSEAFARLINVCYNLMKTVFI